MKNNSKSTVPLKPFHKGPWEREEAEDEKIMRELVRDDEEPGREYGTDETLNKANSALSDRPSNGKMPKHSALGDQ